MHKEQITDKEGICLLTMFILGSTMILGIGGEAKNDAWIAGLCGMLFAVPIILVYSRILALFPEKDLYEILEKIFGKKFAKVLSVIYIWYAFHLGALVIRNFGEFINTVAMPETPLIVPMLVLGIVCIFAVRAGVEVMARVSAYTLPFMMFIIVTVQLLGIPALHFHYIKPVLTKGLAPIMKGAFSAFSFPFAETVVFIGVFFTLKKRKSIYKVYISGLFFAGTIVLILTLRNIFVLGAFIDKLYFPSHVAVSRIRIGDFLERIEVTVAVVFVLGVFVKTSVCLFVACKGLARIFNLQDYRTVVIHTGLLMVYFSYSLYSNIMEMQYWAFKVYNYYAFPFQVIIPLFLLVSAKIKLKNK